MKTCSIALLILALAACAGSAPRIDPARVAALQKGTTTVGEVVQQFGRPSLISRNPDGTQSATYLHGAERQSGTTMVPLLASIPVDSTTFYFDPNGVMADYKITQTSKAAPAETFKPAAAPASSEKSADAAAARPVRPVAEKPVQTTTTTITTLAGATSKTKAAPVNDSNFFPGATVENR